MKIFVDSADIQDIELALSLGVVQGITTNPTLISKTGRNPLEVIKEICNITAFDVSAEVFAESYDEIIEQGKKLLSIAENVVLKMPVTQNGIMACKFFSSKKYKTNLTLCFSPMQALMAARAGATYVSPFIGRLDDIKQDGLGLIRNIKTIYSNYPEIKTQILAASIRSIHHVEECAKIGAHAATMPVKLIDELYRHELTDKGLEIFRKDIESLGIPI
ncbi:MAG: transaldolase family protein [Rickettsiaceae bacterium]|nr:transaldolase family protein [Rickettsiaceae bacterium]